jgi:glycogen debranching enzyme
LLRAGETGVQLTWMDARVGDWVVTPRHGKPVEVQALWYNALRILEDLAARFGDEERQAGCASLAEKARSSFDRSFWNEGRNCLFDVIDGDARDGSLRPNQIFAISLRHPVLDRERWAPVLEAVQRELLTTYGLRTLAPADAGYCPRYQGGVVSRDGAYHQGTVWPWLLGAFIEATAKAKGNAASAESDALPEPLVAHLQNAGLGQISEIFDADPPNEPRGCSAQAWSVAEVLRVRRLLKQRQMVSAGLQRISDIQGC